jgi:hypothetical protein
VGVFLRLSCVFDCRQCFGVLLLPVELTVVHEPRCAQVALQLNAARNALTRTLSCKNMVHNAVFCCLSHEFDSCFADTGVRWPALVSHLPTYICAYWLLQLLAAVALQ